MRLRATALFALLTLLMAACQGPPPTQIVLVVTATAETATETSAESGTPTVALATDSGGTPTGTAAAAATPTLMPTLAPTATPEVFPTPTTGNIQVAEQLFQRGRMFWVEPTRQIWVLIVTGEGRGRWMIYPDTFQDGVDSEVDTSLVPPGDGLIQPERGFGKLWRSNRDVNEALGWATTPEFGYVSPYEYHPGGTINPNGEYVVAPGYHILYSLYQEQFRFNEVDGTWQLGG